MPAVCLAFTIHQSYRLRRYSIFDAAPQYVDDAATEQAVTHAAQGAYLPALRLLLAAAKRHRSGPHAFRVAIAISGTAVELLERHAPEVVQLLHALHATGTVEFLGETYYSSLAALFSRAEFAEQVRLHSQMLKRLFSVTPKVFRNTELLYNNEIALAARELGFEALFTEATETILNSRSASFLYSAPSGNWTLDTGHSSPPRLLLRHSLLSDALGRRLADPGAPLFPLTLEKFSATLADIGGQICNLFLDLESFGHWESPPPPPHSPGVAAAPVSASASLKVLDDLLAFFPGSNFQMLTPSEALAKLPSAGELDIPQLVSPSGPQRDATPWLGNAMQTSSQKDLYKLEGPVKTSGDRALLADLRMLTAADHAWYMSTRPAAEDALRNPSPYESPYDAYINFMNILDNMKVRAKV